MDTFANINRIHVSGDIFGKQLTYFQEGMKL